MSDSNSKTDSPRANATESDAADMKTQIQPSHGTKMNRYPEEYANLKSILLTETVDLAIKKVLSFGCSTGEEPLTLAQQYFTDPTVQIYGVDVADLAVTQAQQKATQAPEGKITILDGRQVNLMDHGPFDIILANSVFCIYGYRHVDFRNITYVMETFPFETFQSMLGDIDMYLKVGGILAIHNSNYNFLETELAQSKYQALTSDDSKWKCPNHFVPRIDRVAKRFINVEQTPMDCLFRKLK